MVVQNTAISMDLTPVIINKIKYLKNAMAYWEGKGNRFDPRNEAMRGRP
jgi:hypothetical protein